jgi:hypothetical protein
MMALGQGEHMPAHHRSPHGTDQKVIHGLDDVDMAALRQLDDTRFLAVGHLDGSACERLARVGLVSRQADDYWKITPTGRRLIQARESKRANG